MWQCECEKCGHIWKTRTPEPPEVCPKCKSRKWNESGAVKTGKHMMTLPKLPSTVNPQDFSQQHSAKTLPNDQYVELEDGTIIDR
jgi:hypothetical protein